MFGIKLIGRRKDEKRKLFVTSIVVQGSEEHRHQSIKIHPDKA